MIRASFLLSPVSLAGQQVSSCCSEKAYCWLERQLEGPRPLALLLGLHSQGPAWVSGHLA